MDRLRYPFVLLDAGGTLFGPRTSFGTVYAEVLGALGVALPADALDRAIRACWDEFNLAHTPGVDRYRLGGEGAFWLRFVEGVLARTPGTPPDASLGRRALEPLRDAFRKPGSWRVFDDVVPALRTLREMDARLAVVSNWDGRLPSLLETLGIGAWFDAIVVSSAEGLEKPHPDLFLTAVARLSGSPERTLHVGDTPELDGAGARAAGIASILVDRTGRLAREQEALPDLTAIPAIVRGDRI